MSDQAVVVTGLGAVTPLGNDVPSTWAGLIAGRSGIRLTERFGLTAPKTAVAGEVRSFSPQQFFSGKRLRHMDLSSHFGVVAALEALRDAGLDHGIPLGHRTGVVFGSGFGGLTTYQRQRDILQT